MAPGKTGSTVVNLKSPPQNSHQISVPPVARCVYVLRTIQTVNKYFSNCFQLFFIHYSNEWTFDA